MKKLLLALLIGFTSVAGFVNEVNASEVSVSGYLDGHTVALYTVIEVFQEDDELEGLALGYDYHLDKYYYIDTYGGIQIGDVVRTEHVDDDIITQELIGFHDYGLFVVVDSVPYGMEYERVLGVNMVTGDKYLLDYYEGANEGDEVFAIYHHDDLIHQYVTN